MNRPGSEKLWFDPFVCLALAIALAGFAPSSLATDYYVSTNGSDLNPGTSLDLPFRTIQQAATVASAGDVVNIRGGIYRETVTPSHSGTREQPIVFRSLPGEAATISGADVLPPESWTPYTSTGYTNVYQAPMGWDLGEGNNQVFVDGQMMIDARWPNVGLDISRPRRARAQSGTHTGGTTGPWTGTITDTNLPSKPASYWNGKTIVIALGPEWWNQVGTITAPPTNSKLTFSFTLQNSSLTPGANDPYYIVGGLEEVDSPGEWFYSTNDLILYLWPPQSDSPTGHVVEAKSRQVAFDLSGHAFITIQDLNVFAATISSDENTYAILLDRIYAKYVSHFRMLVGGENLPGMEDSGILVHGTNNVLRNSTIVFSAGNGVSLTGLSNTVANCVIHEVDYAGGICGAVNTGNRPDLSGGHMIVGNTMYNSAREVFEHRNLVYGYVLSNDIHHAGLQMCDLGATKTGHFDGQGTIIAFNTVHDIKTTADGRSNDGKGIYLDNASTNFIVHHNVTWNVPAALSLNSPSINNLVFNNTLVASSTSVYVYTLPGEITDLTGTLIQNNIFTGSLNSTPNAKVNHNLLKATDPQFTDSANRDYSLKAGSPAIDFGVLIPPYTDNVVDGVPDAGAYEYGLPVWKTGAVVNPPVLAGAVSNQVVNVTDTIAPLGEMTLTAGNSPPQPTTLTVQVDDPEKGVFTAASCSATGFTAQGAGIYTLAFEGTFGMGQMALRALVFSPGSNSAPATIGFTVVAQDAVNPPVTNALTTIRVVMPALLSVQAGLDTDAALQFSLLGESGSSYVIEASTNLTQWERLTTNYLQNTNMVSWIAPTTNLSGCFYRALLLLP